MVTKTGANKFLMLIAAGIIASLIAYVISETILKKQLAKISDGWE